MAGEIIGVVTDPGSSLNRERARERGVLLVDPEEPLEPQYHRFLKYYDRLLSLHASPDLCPMHDMAQEAASAVGKHLVQVVNTRLGSAGLGSAALAAAAVLGRGGDEAAALAEVKRLAREGRFFLATNDLSRLVENRMIPALAGRIGRVLNLWAVLYLEGGRFHTAPMPVTQEQVLPHLAKQLEKTFGDRRIRVRLLVGDLPEEVRDRAKEVLEDYLHIESGTLAPMDPTARARVGDHALAVFAYPA